MKKITSKTVTFPNSKVNMFCRVVMIDKSYFCERFVYFIDVICYVNFFKYVINYISGVCKKI